MVQLDIDDPAQKRLTAAFDLARRFDANLIGFGAADYRVHLPYEGGRAVMEVQRQRQEEITARLELLRESFIDVAGDGPGATWIGRFGHPTELLAIHARSADLLMVGPPRTAEALERDRHVDVGKLVLAAGRPVLLLTKDEAVPRADKIIIAWKDAREARRAVVDALPFLTAARQVIVTTVVENHEGLAREGCAEVVRFLMRHGVKAEETLLPLGKAPPAEAIADLARAIGSDFVVSGGYGHSRLREWAFGGVTRSLIHDGSLNRLFSN
ncbi:MAG: universal stress protein [Paracoccus sp.]|nr:universal stress protein [Paracoccus sp. (in: a-proteobacteria)]